jgi:hypothetical protein
MCVGRYYDFMGSYAKKTIILVRLFFVVKVYRKVVEAIKIS